jgi:hypothetical protein
MSRGARDLVSACSAVAADHTFRYHATPAMPADRMIGIQTGELLVHGWDVARAL